jgi:two-component system cell cycle sensor histidine kinase/response regulator CckA
MFLLAIQDITERKQREEEVRRAQEELRASEQRLRFMAESMPQKIFTATPRGAIDYFNQQWMEFTALSFEQIRNWGWTQFIHPDDLNENLRLWQHSLDTGEPFQCMHRLRRADGEYRWHLSRALAMRNGDGKIAMWIGSNTDIHEEREHEEQLRQTQKLESIGLLAGGVAHDFNNLLTGILGNASLLLEHASDADRSRIEDVVTSSRKAADLTNQLLAYAGKGRFVITRFDLSGLILEILHLLEISIPKKVQLHVSAQPGLPLIEGDASQIQQIVMNLVINAAEAIGADSGTIWVSTGVADVEASDRRKPGRSVFMEVRDSGSGMDEATRAKIFDPFFTTKFLGRGLGLAAVSGIVRGHRGSIVVESALGAGSTFSVFFPAIQAEVPKTTTDSSSPTQLDHVDTRVGVILVVDDEAIVRRLV